MVRGFFTLDTLQLTRSNEQSGALAAGFVIASEGCL